MTISTMTTISVTVETQIRPATTRPITIPMVRSGGGSASVAVFGGGACVEVGEGDGVIGCDEVEVGEGDRVAVCDEVHIWPPKIKSFSSTAAAR